MSLLYRPAREQDLEPAQALVVGSINDLTERHGFGKMASIRPTLFQSFALADDPDGLWVAEDAGEICGFAFSWVCDDLWFLAELFVSRAHQGRGIGNELLKRTEEHARKSGATKKALITFAFNSVSQGLYIRHGMFPRLPIYHFEAAPAGLRERLKEAPLGHAPLEDSPADWRCLAEIDAMALGVSRHKHHRHLIGAAGMKGFALGEPERRVGYAYISPGGHIGPLAVTRPDVLGAAFKTALHLAANSGSTQVSAFIPGINETALGLAADLGMRIIFPMVLAANQDFGRWAQYLPRNPGFM